MYIEGLYIENLDTSDFSSKNITSMYDNKSLSIDKKNNSLVRKYDLDKSTSRFLIGGGYGTSTSIYHSEAYSCQEFNINETTGMLFAINPWCRINAVHDSDNNKNAIIPIKEL